MHILYIHQHFALPSGSTGTRSYEFARRWVEAGHKVTVISRKYVIGGLKTGDKLIEYYHVDGIDVIAAGIGYSNKQSFVRRIWSFIIFMVLGTFAGLRIKGIDIVYATSTPLTVGIPAMLIKCFKRIPYVFEVRDQWPRIPIEMGIIKNGLLKKLLLRLEKTIYKRASAIVALSPGMAKGVKEVLGSDDKVFIVPNSCDTDRFSPDVDGSSIRVKHNWNNKFVVMHFGAMGKANGLDFLIEAAERLKEIPDLHFVLIGSGSEKQRLKREIEKKNLENIEILDSKSKNELPEYVAACDVSTVIFANYPVLEHNSANKFFDSLSAGKLVLLNYSGWQREIIEKCNAGLGCELYNINEFVDKVKKLISDMESRIQMGKNSRKLAIEEFNRDVLADKALSAISSVNTK